MSIFKIMKKAYISFFLFLMYSSLMWAQKVTIEPLVFTATDSIKITVDVSQCDCKKLVDDAGPLYLWTWVPNTTTTNANGDWANSSEAMSMTNVGPNLWSYQYGPLDKFFGISAADIYKAGKIGLLVKKDDGGSGGSCDKENKTEDITIDVKQPSVGPRKMFTFPDAPNNADTVFVTPDDAFTLIYDKALETKANLSAATEYMVFPKAILDDASTISLVSVSGASAKTELAMTLKEGETTKYRWTVIPSKLFAGKVPAGKKITALKLQVVVRKTPITADDASEIKQYFIINE